MLSKYFNKNLISHLFRLYELFNIYFNIRRLYLDSYGTLEEFFSFLYLKNDLENVQDQNNKCVYWAFESSASITNNESNTISR